ncbi:MAG: hypothetical protein JWO39_1505 [Gemmatimonadetes bacterium]|jgi:hypothetical protein|nr:hypothetical protein [Gemmatimonadota bacterium]
MLPDSPNQQPVDSRVNESTHGNANRRLRTSLELVFQDSQLHNADASASAHRELRVALRQVCMEARRAGLRAEQLLVLIKDVWSGIPAGISRVKSMHGDERLNYVISTCVDEYYGDDGKDEPSEREVSP